MQSWPASRKGRSTSESSVASGESGSGSGAEPQVERAQGGTGRPGHRAGGRGDEHVLERELAQQCGREGPEGAGQRGAEGAALELAQGRRGPRRPGEEIPGDAPRQSGADRVELAGPERFDQLDQHDQNRHQHHADDAGLDGRGREARRRCRRRGNGGAQRTVAVHSISTRAPSASPEAPMALRAGLGPGKKVTYTEFIRPHSAMSASITRQRTTRSIPEPLASRKFLMLVRVCRVSGSIPPATRRLVLSVPSWPER